MNVHLLRSDDGKLNKSNKAFLDYLTSNYASEILANNKTKLHLETGNIYRGKTNLEESIYDFLISQQNKTKKLLDYEIHFTGDFDSYMDQIINPLPTIGMIYVLTVRLDFHSIFLII